MYTWSRVLAAISKKCGDPKVLVAEQVVWLDAACYRPHTLIWWRRLWIWLRHSSIGIATHCHTWDLLHTFRIFFCQFQVVSIFTLWFLRFLVKQKCHSKPCCFQQNLIGFQTHFPPFVGLCPKFRFDGSELCVLSHPRHLCSKKMQRDNLAIKWIFLHGFPQIGWTGNENSKCGEFKGDKLGRLCMLSISTLPQVSQHRCQPRNLLPLSPTFPGPPPMRGVISKSENPNCWS